MAKDSEIGVEDRVHEALKNGGRGREAHGHHRIFIEAVEGFESC